MLFHHGCFKISDVHAVSWCLMVAHSVSWCLMLPHHGSCFKTEVAQKFSTYTPLISESHQHASAMYTIVMTWES